MNSKITVLGVTLCAISQFCLTCASLADMPPYPHRHPRFTPPTDTKTTPENPADKASKTGTVIPADQTATKPDGKEQTNKPASDTANGGKIDKAPDKTASEADSKKSVNKHGKPEQALKKEKEASADKKANAEVNKKKDAKTEKPKEVSELTKPDPSHMYRPGEPTIPTQFDTKP